MRHRNIGGATTPNAPIDLTSLLDVIFILLFIVIIALAGIANKINSKNTEADEKLAKASALLAQAQEMQTALENEEQAYKNAIDAFSSSQKYVKMISITCTWNNSNAMIRSIKVVVPDKTFPSWTLTGENEDEIFSDIKNALSDYISSFSNLDAYICIVSLNSQQILRRDFEEIQSLINEIGKAEENVYFTTTDVMAQ